MSRGEVDSFFFFFSSRRRHTRLTCDWSSDVCSSDLAASTPAGQLGRTMGAAEAGRELGDAGGPVLVGAFGLISLTAGLGALAAALLICAGLAAPRNRGGAPRLLAG